MEDKRVTVATAHPYYFELEHSEPILAAKLCYLLSDRVEISRSGTFTCPLKTLAIFVHN